jgi:hypothetical protein
MICARNYRTIGPYEIRPYGNPREATLYRVVDGLGRRITEPMKRADATRLCRLLNDVFDSAIRTRLVLALRE